MTHNSVDSSIKLPMGGDIEICRPKETVAQLYHARCFDHGCDVAQPGMIRARSVVAPVFDTQEGGWTYFRHRMYGVSAAGTVAEPTT